MRVLVIGGDRRMNYTAEKLSELFETARLGSGADNGVSGRFGAVVLPLPLTKNGSDIFAPSSREILTFEIISQFAEDGALILAGGESEKLTRFCDENDYRLENYFSHETLTLKNAALTAEAACAILSQSTDSALLSARALITGYGRIGRFLAARLKANGCAVTVAARRAEQRITAELDGFASVSFEELSEKLGNYDFIANTVPHVLFFEEEFRRMHAKCVFIELASVSEEPARSFAKNCGVKYIYASGLPGKCSPKAAGIFIAEEVEKYLNKLTDTAQIARPTT